MKRKLTDNIGLKILAVIVATLLWLISVNINDPTQTKTFRDIPVEILNKEVLTNDGKVYEVLDNTDVIDRIQITGKRSILDEINNENIVATADMTEHTFNDTVHINVTTNKYASRLEGNINASIDTLKIKVEDMKKAQLVVKPVTKDEPASGYMVGNISINQNLVHLSGPESVMSQIASAKVTVSVAGVKEDIKTEGTLELYDTEGNLIDSSNITKSINKFNVTVEILQQKEVPFVVTTVGTPAAGYQPTGVIECAPETIVIAGKSNVVKNISEILVDDIDIEGATEDVLSYIEPKRYLPENTSLVGGNSANVAAVKVYIEPEVTKTFTLDAANMQVLGLPEDMTMNLDEMEETMEVTIQGLQANVDAIAEDSMIGMVDVAAFMEENQIEELKEGRYNINVSYNLPENVTLAEEVQIIMVIEKEVAE